MSLPMLVAIVLAFGLGDRTGGGAVGGELLGTRLREGAWFLIGLGLLARGLGLVLAGLFRRRRRLRGGLSASSFRALRWAELGLDLAALGGFAWMLDGLEWPRIVAWNLGLRDWIAVDEFVRIAPYLALQMLAWSGLSRAKDAAEGGKRRPGRTFRRARVAFGLVLPMMLLYAAGRDLARFAAGDLADDPSVQLGLVLGLGTLVLLVAPAFLRIAWPTRPLPPGPLRDRLEGLAARARFRHRNILVWDTGDSMLNAAVTGSLPKFRYVLLTDALLTRIPPVEVEAIFGHEIGHSAHRHFFHFGAFLAGSVGVAALIEWGVLASAGAWPWEMPRIFTRNAEYWQVGVALAILAGYFGAVFGLLSRRSERQADIFGCRSVSCGRSDCDPLTHAVLRATATTIPDRPCPEGILTFSAALEAVSARNGMSLRSWSWNHGRTADRLTFVRGLAGRPERLEEFETGIHRLRRRLAFGLTACCLAAIGLHWADIPEPSAPPSERSETRSARDEPRRVPGPGAGRSEVRARRRAEEARLRARRASSGR